MWVGVAATQGGPIDDFCAVVRASSCVLAEVQLVRLNLVSKKLKERKIADLYIAIHLSI